MQQRLPHVNEEETNVGLILLFSAAAFLWMFWRASAEGETSTTGDVNRARVSLGKYRPIMIGETDAGFVCHSFAWIALWLEFGQFASFGFLPAFQWGGGDKGITHYMQALCIDPSILHINPHITLWCCFAVYAALLFAVTLAWGPGWLCSHAMKFISLRYSEGGCCCCSGTGHGGHAGEGDAGGGDSANISAGGSPLIGGSSSSAAFSPGSSSSSHGSPNSSGRSNRQKRGEKLARQKTGGGEELASPHSHADLAVSADDSSSSSSSAAACSFLTGLRTFLRDPYRKDDMGALFLDLLFIPVLRQCFAVIDCVPGPDARMYVGSACISNASSDLSNSSSSVESTNSSSLCSNFQDLPSYSECWTASHQVDVIGSMLLVGCLTYSSLHFLVFHARDKFLGTQARFGVMLGLSKFILSAMVALFAHQPWWTSSTLLLLALVLTAYAFWQQPCQDAAREGALCNNIRFCNLSAATLTSLFAMISILLADPNDTTLLYVFIPIVLVLWVACFFFNQPRAQAKLSFRQGILMADVRALLSSSQWSEVTTVTQYGRMFLFHMLPDEEHPEDLVRSFPQNVWLQLGWKVQLGYEQRPTQSQMHKCQRCLNALTKLQRGKRVRLIDTRSLGLVAADAGLICQALDGRQDNLVQSLSTIPVADLRRKALLSDPSSSSSAQATPASKNLSADWTALELNNPAVTATGKVHRRRSSAARSSLTSADLSTGGKAAEVRYPENIGDCEAVILAHVLKGMNGNYLNSISLKFNQIGDIGAIAIFEAIVSSKVTSLDFEGNLVGNEGASRIATILNHTSLRMLNLKDNVIGNVGSETLSNALVLNNNLSMLLISGNVEDERYKQSMKSAWARGRGRRASDCFV